MGPLAYETLILPACFGGSHFFSFNSSELIFSSQECVYFIRKLLELWNKLCKQTIRKELYNAYFRLIMEIDENSKFFFIAVVLL